MKNSDEKSSIESFRRKLFREVLPFVTKPARYAGSEMNSVVKPHDADLLKIALCFPEMYEIGMSYLGMQILYNIINKRNDSLAERAFAVWPDMEERMRENGIPLFSLETSTPLREFDVLGFHLTYEMTYATALSMLGLADIPIRADARTESDPLILAGGSSVMNPEPMADFIDAFFIGEAEESIGGIIETIRKAKESGLDRESTLKMLSGIPGIYIPRFYEPVYDNNGRFRELQRLFPDVPDRIKYVTVKELKTEYYPSKPIIPFIEIVHDHLSVEIMRGCVRGCRFCQAGFQYRPQRQREPRQIANQIASAIHETGYEDVTLLSLSSTDYERLNELLAMIGPVVNGNKVAVGLPSLRPETISPSLLNTMSGFRKTGLTLAPEAGTERLRNCLGKNIRDDEIIGAIETALSEGHKSIKLYFMVGLPRETLEDIDAIGELLRRISYLARKGGADINVTLSPFMPKTHTPWQWEEQSTKALLKEKINGIVRTARKPNTTIRYPDLDLCVIEGVLGRGDRRIGRAICNAYQYGSRLDGWSEWFDSERWKRAFDDAGLDISFYMGRIDPSMPLPWDHIDKGISKDFLIKDNEDSKNAIPPRTKFDRKIEQPRPSGGEFGRKSRRASPARASTIPGTYKLRIRYSRGEELRFLSHLDMIRTTYRAIRRSGIPVAFSEGFHPHIKISFGPPLPVGYTSEAEFMDIQLAQPFRDEFIRSLDAAFPGGMKIEGFKHYFAKSESLSKQLNLARYELTCDSEIKIDLLKLETLLSTREIIVTRVKDDSEFEIDAGRFIIDLRLENDLFVMDINQTPEGQIKPEEILIFGFGIESEIVKSLIIHRKMQFHKLGERLLDPLGLV